MFKAKEHMQTVKLPLHWVKLKLIWYNWESTCVKTHIIWPCSLWRLADANDCCVSSFFKDFSFFTTFTCFIIFPWYNIHCSFGKSYIARVYSSTKIAGEITTHSPSVSVYEKPCFVFVRWAMRQVKDLVDYQSPVIICLWKMYSSIFLCCGGCCTPPYHNKN